MALRVTRPGFLEGIAALKRVQGVTEYDVNRDASRLELRTYVCAQCHVEYYFAGQEKRLTYPWDKGLTADSILAYYEENGHRDWVHAASGAPTLKAQHPEFEMYSQGIHARSQVACADCHMPYTRQGAMKISDHWVRSPALNVNNACQTCHTWPEEELLDRIALIQDRTFELRNLALDATLDLTRAIAAAARADSAAAGLTGARAHQRRAQFLTDFVEAENSMGFHAPQEAARILGLAINEARLGQAALHGSTGPSATARPLPPPQTVTPRAR
jgi:nitrite reductase (cytochrome c-552)